MNAALPFMSQPPLQQYSTFEPNDSAFLIWLFIGTVACVLTLIFSFAGSIYTDPGFKKKVAIVLSLLVATTSLVGVITLSFERINHIDREITQAEERLNKDLQEKYGVTLSETALKADKRAPSNGKIFFTKEIFEATSQDGKNIRISIETTDSGKSVTAYSSDVELPTKNH